MSGARIYWRNGRAYGDFREYSDVGGGRESLKPEGRSRATKDADEALRLYTARLEALKAARAHAEQVARLKRDGKYDDVVQIIEPDEGATLQAFAARHLKRKAVDKEATRRWLLEVERHLRAAVEFFGADRSLRTIEPGDVDGWVDHLRSLPGRKGATVQDPTVRKYLNSLSNLYARAISDGKASSNPVGDMYAKPSGVADGEAEYLAAHEAALFLESARTFQPRVDDGGYPYVYPLIATFMLTGGRKSEVLGLEVDDVSFAHGKIYFRPNTWRRLKTTRSKRTVPLWPQLETILRAYMAERERTGGLGRLLFPSGRTEAEGMITDVRKALDRIAVRAGFPKGHVRLHMLRHTYTAARIQTCDRGRPVALFTVARELGHRTTDTTERVYSHLHDRATEGCPEIVEYRVEHHRDRLAETLATL